MRWVVTEIVESLETRYFEITFVNFRKFNYYKLNVRKAVGHA